ncbi:MAG: type VI secretion system lipoprotein TssJ [Pseudomonadota bacterium]
MMPIQRFVWLFAITVLFGLTGCATAPKPIAVKASLEAQKSINPDLRGRPSPVVVRVYALKSLAAFNGADFFSLFDKDKEVLGADLIDREELQLLPGQQRALEKVFPPETRHIAVIAAFRDLERSQWRATADIPAKQTKITAQILLDGKKVSIATGK